MWKRWTLVGDVADNRRAEHPCGSWFPRSLLLLPQPLWDFSLLSLVKKRGLSGMGTIGVVASIGRGNCLNILLDFLIAKSSPCKHSVAVRQVL